MTKKKGQCTRRIFYATTKGKCLKCGRKIKLEPCVDRTIAFDRCSIEEILPYIQGFLYNFGCLTEDRMIITMRIEPKRKLEE